MSTVKVVKIKIIKKFMPMINVIVLHLLYFLKEQTFHLRAGPNHCFMYFLKFEKSVSGEEFQVQGPRVVKLLSPYLTVL